MVQIFLQHPQASDLDVLELPPCLSGLDLTCIVQKHLGLCDELRDAIFLVIGCQRVNLKASLTLLELDTVYVSIPIQGGIDFQHREGGKTGSGGVLNEAQVGKSYTMHHTPYTTCHNSYTMSLLPLIIEYKPSFRLSHIKHYSLCTPHTISTHHGP
ncbi:hypothetical protein EON63_13585 [archaeon]|nr:MAG: hypothetical protein EON63_13585 [archaeon]